MPTSGEIDSILRRALSSGGDFAELFLEDREDLSIRCLDGSARGATSLHIRGAGIHLLRGTTAVYVYSSDRSISGLLGLAGTAASLLDVRGSAPGAVAAPGQVLRYPTPIPVRLPPGSIEAARKIHILEAMDAAARSEGGVRSLTANYFDTVQHIMVANSEGLTAEDERVRTRVRLDTTVESGSGSLFEFDDFVGTRGFELFEGDYEGFARSQVVSMKARLRAVPIPSCVVPVVIEGGKGGVLWHEACGHPLEAENLVAGFGDFAGRFGTVVASPKVTLVDDGSLPGMYGSEAMDDEGRPTRRTVLIRNGVLEGCLCSTRGARLLGREPTGSGRRQSYAFAPTSRMHNTHLEAGEDDEDEMIRSMPEGLFVTGLGGGDSGAEFSIEVKEAFWVQNGAISHQVRGITLSGNSLEMMRRVDRVGRRLIPEQGGSFCGASSGLVPTTAFQPRIRISEMQVGGVTR
jgi:TldD protein